MKSEQEQRRDNWIVTLILIGLFGLVVFMIMVIIDEVPFLRDSCFNVSYTNGNTWTNNNCDFDILQDCNNQCDRFFPLNITVNENNILEVENRISGNNYCRYNCDLKYGRWRTQPKR